MTNQPYSAQFSAQLRVIHAQLGECKIFPDSVTNRAGLYVSATGKRLAKLVEQAEVSMQLIPFVDTLTGPVKVYETSVKGKLNGLPIEVYLRECKDTLDGGTYYGVLVVGMHVDNKPVTVEMFPDGPKGLRVNSYTTSNEGEEEKERLVSAAVKKLNAIMPPENIGASELVRELFDPSAEIRERDVLLESDLPRLGLKFDRHFGTSEDMPIYSRKGTGELFMLKPNGIGRYNVYLKIQ